MTTQGAIAAMGRRPRRKLIRAAKALAVGPVLAVLAVLAVCAIGLQPSPAQAQSTPSAPGASIATPPTCLLPAEVQATHLYGLWNAHFDGLPGRATLLFEKSPEHPDGVRGQVRREDTIGRVRMDLVAGDVDDGDFTLEESADGRRIDANWVGTVTEGSCGQEIRGTWTRASDHAQHPFVLRKHRGW